MAVSLTGTSKSFVGTGVPSVYAPDFYVNSSNQVVVHVAGSLKTIGDDYTVSNVGGSTGCTVTGNFAAGAAVLIERVTPIVQLVDTQNNETILEDVLDGEFDTLTMIAQEVNAKADRALALIAGGGAAGFAVSAVTTEALAANDFVNVYYTGGALKVRKASAAAADRYATGFVVALAAMGKTVSVVPVGLNPVVTGLSGEVWLSDTVPGAFTGVPPATSGSLIQSLGQAMPGVGVFFTPQGRVLL